MNSSICKHCLLCFCVCSTRQVWHIRCALFECIGRMAESMYGSFRKPNISFPPGSLSRGPLSKFGLFQPHWIPLARNSHLVSLYDLIKKRRFSSPIRPTIHQRPAGAVDIFSFTERHKSCFVAFMKDSVLWRMGMRKEMIICEKNCCEGHWVSRQGIGFHRILWYRPLSDLRDVLYSPSDIKGTNYSKRKSLRCHWFAILLDEKMVLCAWCCVMLFFKLSHGWWLFSF